MRNTTKRIAAVSAAIAGVALIGSACQTKEKTEGALTTTSPATTTVTSSAVEGTTTAAASTTEMQGQDGKTYTVSGDILAKYESLDSTAKQDLGEPIDNEKKNPDGGVFQQFDGGVIVHTTRSYVVWGKIRDKWNELGGSQGKLGYPTSDEVDTPDGGKKTTFEHGAITWKPGEEEATVEMN